MIIFKMDDAHDYLGEKMHTRRKMMVSTLSVSSFVKFAITLKMEESSRQFMIINLMAFSFFRPKLTFFF